MKNTITLLKPGNSWRISEHESWYSYMADKGLLLQATGSQFDTFKKSTPSKMKYRIEVSSKSLSITDEQKSMYEESGWFYVDSWLYTNGYRYFHVFSSLEALNSPEIHTDPTEQGYTLKDLNKNLMLNALATVVMTSIYIIWLIYGWNKSSMPWLNLINSNSHLSIILFLLFCFLIIESIRSSLAINKLRKNLLYGKPLNHDADWRRSMFVAKILAVLYLLALTLFVLAFFYPTPKSYLHTSEKEVNQLPIIMLQDIEDTNKIERTASGFSPYPDQNNYFESKKSLLAPINYYSLEQGIIKTSSTYSKAYIRTNTYKLRLHWLAENIFEEVLKEESRYKIFTQCNNPNLDQIWINESEDSFSIIALHDNVVISLYYSGDKKIEKGIDELIEKFDFIADTMKKS